MAKNLYEKIIEHIFYKHYKSGTEIFEFERSELTDAAKALDLSVPKNLGDILSSFRFRRKLPNSILKTEPEDKEWFLVLAGRGKYRFVLREPVNVVPRSGLSPIDIPDATPQIVKQYALNDEQALLAILRYNRIIDIFLSLTCYSLQNHLRTTAKGVGQVEVDELYVGLDSDGKVYTVPVQAKGGNDRSSVVQIEQDFRVCQEKFPHAKCRPVAAQFINNQTVALFEFVEIDGYAKIRTEKHYRLVEEEPDN